MNFLATGALLGSPLAGAEEEEQSKSLTMKCGMEGSVPCACKHVPAPSVFGETEQSACWVGSLQTSAGSLSPVLRSSLRRERGF